MAEWPYRCPELGYTPTQEAAKRTRRKAQWDRRHVARPVPGRMIRVPVYSGANRQLRRMRRRRVAA